MKKLLAIIVNLSLLLVLLLAILVLQHNNMGGNAFSFFQQDSYLNSSAFQAKLSQSVSDIFEFVGLKNSFETDNVFNINKSIVAVENNGVTNSYTIDSMVKLARQYGYYLNEKNELQFENPGDGSRTADRDQRVRVSYRAYMPDFQPKSPTDGLMRMPDLAKEILGYLSRYYILKNELRGAGNLKYDLRYWVKDESLPTVCYSNDENMQISDIMALGKYFYTTSETMETNTNFQWVPDSMMALLDSDNPYKDVGGEYDFAVGVDTSFPAPDDYASAAIEYTRKRKNSITASMALLFSFLGVISSLAYLFYASGDQRRDGKIHLYEIDHLFLEGKIAFLVLWFWLLRLFVPRLLDAMELTFGTFSDWELISPLIGFFLFYLMAVPVLLSLVRCYKAELLYRYSLFRGIREAAEHFLRAANQTAPKLFHTAMFLIPNLLAMVLAVILLIRFLRNASLMSLITLLFLVAVMSLSDYYIFRMADGLNRAVSEQVKAERLKADLITNVSHDLKTPLTSIINYVDLLKMEKTTNPKVSEYIAVLEQKSQRLKSLTEDLVEASKANSGNVNMRFRKINYVEILNQAIGEFEDRFETNGLVTVTALPEHSVYVCADGRHLWRVLENLLNNCNKYALPKSRVYIDMTETEERAAVTIKNISSEPLNITPEELTERFVRGDVSRTKEGSGLGLSIAKSLAALMKGELRIEIDGDLYKATVELRKWEEKEESGRS